MEGMEGQDAESSPLLSSAPRPFHADGDPWTGAQGGPQGLLLASAPLAVRPSLLDDPTFVPSDGRSAGESLLGGGDGSAGVEQSATRSLGETAAALGADPTAATPKKHRTRAKERDEEDELDLEKGRRRSRRKTGRRKRRSGRRRGLDDEEGEEERFEEDFLMEDSLDASDLRDSKQLTPKHIFYNYYSAQVTWDERMEQEQEGKLMSKLTKLAVSFIAKHKFEFIALFIFLFILFLLRISGT